MTSTPTPQYWLKRAEETREQALGLKDSDTRDKLETVACLYEELAEFAAVARLSRVNHLKYSPNDEFA